MRTPKAMKRDIRDLGWVVKGSAAPAMSSLIPAVAGNDEGRMRKRHQINAWLRGWCSRQDFGFFNLGSLYASPDMLVTDRAHLSQGRRRTLGQELAGLTERALN